MKWLALLCLMCASFVLTAHAIPQQINYQGSLTSPTGTALDTTVAMTFKLYTDSTAGTLLWTETRPVLVVTDGLFNVRLGQLTALTDAILNNAQVWLGITVGNNSEMTPRTRMVSVGYAYRVGTVDGASGGIISGDVNLSGKANIGSGNTNVGVFAFVAGQNSTAAGANSVVSGGIYNKARGSYAVIGGGGSGSEVDSNSAVGNSTFIGGGRRNLASGVVATIAGGEANVSSASRSTVGGGIRNTASNLQATVGGGEDNAASGSHAFVGGGGFSYARGAFATVAGGGGDAVTDSNSARGEASAIGGGRQNEAILTYAFVGGGLNNVANDTAATISGGRNNGSSGLYSTIGGGDGNAADGNWATVGGGFDNSASASYSTIPGGISNIASGQFSFAAGRSARATHDGSFVWGCGPVVTDSWGTNTFTARVLGGAHFYTTVGGAGVELPANGGAWANLCDVNQKRLYGDVNTSNVLQKVSSLPLYRWSYKSQDESIQHIGPTAQDFYAAFGLGDNNTTISTLDPDGIALAAIQELAKKIREMDELKGEVMELRAAVQTLQANVKQSNLK